MQQRSRDELFLVDDDVHLHDLLSIVFTDAGFALTCFAESEPFLAEARKRTPTCVLLDIHMPGCSGLETLSKIDAHHYRAPIIIMSGQGEIPVVVDAVKRGAFDFVEKPFKTDYLVTRVRAAIDGWTRRTTVRAAAGPPRQFRGQELLTPREHEVLVQIATGSSNKETAHQLGISPRTVEVHRFRIMDKLQAKNAVDLTRIVLNFDPPIASGSAPAV
jgi:two-component system, LuxR family, response regulator FixJ